MRSCTPRDILHRCAFFWGMSQEEEIDMPAGGGGL
jgi:hypothetical protein